MIHEMYYQSPMPPTCKGVTTPDTAIVHPMLVQRMQGFTVDNQALFDAHAPVVISFHIPGQELFTTRLKTPKSWTELPIDSSDLQASAQVICQHPEPTNLLQWAQLVEATVDHAIQVEHAKNPTLQPLPKLPKDLKDDALIQNSFEFHLSLQ